LLDFIYLAPKLVVNISDVPSINEVTMVTILFSLGDFPLSLAFEIYIWARVKYWSSSCV